MNNQALSSKETKAYTLLVSLVICGLASSLITGPKAIHFGLNFPFSNIVFSMLTYPIVDCICELFGKQAARQAMWLGLGSQLFIAIIIQLSIFAPAASFWQLQKEYETVLGIGMHVVAASIIAFSLSQLLDIFIYQRIKELSRGKNLWLRSNLSTYIGQITDSCLFVMIVFYDSDQKLKILVGSIIVKMIISLLMTPIIYLIVIAVDRYLESNTLAFKDENSAATESGHPASS